MEEKLKYTVYEHKERGTRFFSSYDENGETNDLKIVDHTKTIPEAQALCSVTERKNFSSFFDDMKDTVGGDEEFIKSIDRFERFITPRSNRLISVGDNGKTKTKK